MKKRRLNKKRLTIFILTVLLMFSSLGLGIYSFAKYTTQESSKALIVPADFQFSSNYLKENNPVYNVYNLDEGIKIELYNYVNINKSEIDIPYTVTVTNGTSNVNNGVLTTSENADSIVITPTNINIPVRVSVSSNTYDYTLSANFNIINTGDNPYYSFTDENDYCILSIYISSENVTGLSINWDSNYTPDNNNSSMKNWIGTTGTVSLNKNSKYDFIFFKNTNIVCSNITNMIIQNNIITLP